ncbi:hypothetical protein DE146DRAFT_739583 [Phaeosphaeria sp. MPI-PUGE-AT-0046c]|nr:hypothetical protein DE146DRAFT_739583 [Phaeosphaeria sp. MPI-PUGE-AT-0046c]
MSLIKLFALALATSATASSFYGNLPAPSSGQGNVVVATTVVTVTSIVKGPATEFPTPSDLEPVVTSAPVVTVPVGPLPTAPAPWVELSSWEPFNATVASEHPSVTFPVLPPGTYPIPVPSGQNTTLVISVTANATSHYHTGSPTGSAIATKTTGPDSGVGKVKAGVAGAFAAIAVAVLGA